MPDPLEYLERYQNADNLLEQSEAESHLLFSLHSRYDHQTAMEAREMLETEGVDETYDWIESLEPENHGSDTAGKTV